MTQQAEAARRRAARLRVWWLTERYVAVLLCLGSVALFIGGAWVGGNAILRAPHKAPPMVSLSPPAQAAPSPPRPAAPP